MAKKYTEITVNNEKIGVCRLFNNKRCALGQTPDGRFVLYIRESGDFKLFGIDEGDKLNRFLIDNSLVGVILYKGRRAGAEITLIELPERGFSLKIDADMENYYDTDEDKTNLTHALIGTLDFSPENPADIHVLKQIGEYYKEFL